MMHCTYIFICKQQPFYAIKQYGSTVFSRDHTKLPCSTKNAAFKIILKTSYVMKSICME